jgi:sugar/nucleoside kinase (ribokinase family)
MQNITDTLLGLLGEIPREQPAITIIGDLNYDWIYSCPQLERGKEVLISSYSRQIAGAGGYVACGMARLGARVDFVTELGADAEGRELYEEIARRGIGRQRTRLVEGQRSPFTLIFSEAGEEMPRQAATYQGTLADFALRPGDFPSLAGSCELVYSCSYFIMPALRAVMGEIFRRCRTAGIRTAYDANAGDQWGDPKALRILREEIYPQSDFIFLNGAEAHSLTGLEDPRKAAEAVQPPGATVVVKGGPRGVVLRHEGRLIDLDAFPLPSKVMDTVGAGDSFQAAFLYFSLSGLPPSLSAVLGAANAASTVLFTGGTTGQLDRDGLARFIRDYAILDGGEGGIRVQMRSPDLSSRGTR